MLFFNGVLKGIVLFLATLPGTLLSQEIVWEPVPLVHGGYAGHMLEVSPGRYLVCGPSTLHGYHGRGVFLLEENAGAFRDVSPDWYPVRALLQAADGGILCGSASGIRHSADGEQWQLRANADIVAMNRLRDGSIWAATAHGDLLRSTDHGMQWEALPNPPPRANTTRRIDMNEKGWIVAGYNPGTTSISTDGGSTWESTVRIDDSTRVPAYMTHPSLITQRGRILSAFAFADLRVSSRNWDGDAARHRFAPDSEELHVRSLIESPSQTVFLGLGTKPFTPIPSRLRSDSAGIFLSRDEGLHWERINAGLDVMNMILTSSGELLVSTALDGFYLVDTASGDARPLDIGYAVVTDLMNMGYRMTALLDSCSVDGVAFSDDGRHWEWSPVMQYIEPVISPHLIRDATGMLLRGGSQLFESDILHIEFRPLGIDLPTASVGGVPLTCTRLTDGTWLVGDYVSLGIDPGSHIHLFDTQKQRIGAPVSPGAGYIRRIQATQGDTVLIAAEGGMYMSTRITASLVEQFSDNILRANMLPDGTILAGCDGTTASLRFTTNGGATWSAISIGTDIGVFDHAVKDGRVYVLTGRDFDRRGDCVPGTAEGIWYSDDMRNWTRLASTPPTTEITSIAFDGAGRLYAGTRGCGLFRSAQPLAADDQPAHMPDRMHARLYPHPSRGQTLVQLDIPRPGTYRFTMRDLLGRTVLSTENMFTQSGAGSLSLDFSSLPAGSYMLSISGADISTTLPVLVE